MRKFRTLGSARGRQAIGVPTLICNKFLKKYPLMTDSKELADNFINEFNSRMANPRYKIEGVNLVLDPDGVDYDIELDSCSTYSQIVYWVMHLSEKEWFDRDMLRIFISAACSHHGLDPRSRL